MRIIVTTISIALFAFFALSIHVASAHGEASPEDFGLTEGAVIRSSSVGDPDIYIVSATGYKRLILSPAIFSIYGHLRWDGVLEVGSGVRDAYQTSAFFRNCETGDPKVYALEVTSEDIAELHWINVSAEDALVQDDDFFKKVFCMNAEEFASYIVASTYTSLSEVPAYVRGELPQPINETSMPLIFPGGFRVSVFTPEAIGPIRFMAFSPDGILFVSMPSTQGLYKARGGGAIFALPDRDQNGKADEVKTVISGLNDLPHGIAFYGGYLYVAEENAISRYPYLNDGNVGAREVIVSNLPAGASHVSRTIGFSPSGKMYVSIGSSCNFCEETDPRRAAIVEYAPDGTQERVFAQGLRNTVGFVFHPETQDIWGTENGRDWLGDDLPPDEINIVRDGANYGWPYCYGKQVVDPAFNDAARCATTQGSTYDLDAHSAPLGLRFVQGSQFPESWQGDLLVAFHGSWNRTEPTGYKIIRLVVQNNTIVGQQDFITGWLRPDGSKLGRPVDLIFGADGALYISDDYANIIYRVTAS